VGDVDVEAPEVVLAGAADAEDSVRAAVGGRGIGS
jgi:hypothetical protein